MVMAPATASGAFLRQNRENTGGCSRVSLCFAFFLSVLHYVSRMISSHNRMYLL